MQVTNQILELERTLNFNPWHDELGRFTNGPGGIGLSSGSGSFGNLASPKEVGAFKGAINGTWQALVSGGAHKAQDGKIVDENKGGRYGATRKEYNTKSLEVARTVESKLASSFDSIRMGNEALSRAEGAHRSGNEKAKQRNLDKAARCLGQALNVAKTLPKDLGVKITTDKNDKNVSSFETDNPYKSVMSLINTCDYYHDQIISSLK